MYFLLIVSALNRADACGGAATGCATNWGCELVYTADLTTNAQDYPVGVAVASRAAENKLWFAINRMVDTDATTSFAWQNQISGARWACNDNDCDCPTEAVAPLANNLGIFRIGADEFNTAPSIVVEDEGIESTIYVHILGMEEDDAKTCSLATDEDARLREWVFTSNFDTLLDEKAVATDAGQCDIAWDHGEIGFNKVDTSFFAGWTTKDPAEYAQTSDRNFGPSYTWSTPATVGIEGIKSDHVAFAFGTAGNTRIIHHDDTLSSYDVDFGSLTAEINLEGTSDGNWPALMLNEHPTPDEWKVAFAGHNGSSVAAIFVTQCAVSSNCTTDPSTWDTSPDEIITRTTADDVRTIELLSASDGSQHLLWVDHAGQGSSDADQPEVWYARKCPGSAWIAPVELWDATGWSTWLDVGRPHMTLIDNTNRKTVHIAFAAMEGNPFSQTTQFTNSKIIWAHREWTCS